MNKDGQVVKGHFGQCPHPPSSSIDVMPWSTGPVRFNPSVPPWMTGSRSFARSGRAQQVGRIFSAFAGQPSRPQMEKVGWYWTGSIEKFF